MFFLRGVTAFVKDDQIHNTMTKQEIISSIPMISDTDSGNFFLMAGPCVVESRECVMTVAEEVTAVSRSLGIPCIFKASYRKANRSSRSSITGKRDIRALEILAEVRERFAVPVVTDIHSAEEAGMAAAYVDVLQIPAFLCRQSDILEAAAATGKTVNIKKGQFLAPESMKMAAEKVMECGNGRVMLTDRGTTFGYGDLVVDFRGIPTMQKTGLPVVMDITHSLQQPNQGAVTGGRPDMIETIARAAVAVGVDGLFIETHPDPSVAKSDGANMLKLELLPSLLEKLVRIRAAIR